MIALRNAQIDFRIYNKDTSILFKIITTGEGSF